MADSKKKKKKKTVRVRKSWVINPVTRVERSERQYSRQRAKKDLRKQQLEDEE